jgi:hypothetical protein
MFLLLGLPLWLLLWVVRRALRARKIQGHSSIR